MDLAAELLRAMLGISGTSEVGFVVLFFLQKNHLTTRQPVSTEQHKTLIRCRDGHQRFSQMLLWLVEGPIAALMYQTTESLHSLSSTVKNSGSGSQALLVFCCIQLAPFGSKSPSVCCDLAAATLLLIACLGADELLLLGSRAVPKFASGRRCPPKSSKRLLRPKATATWRSCQLLPRFLLFESGFQI